MGAGEHSEWFAVWEQMYGPEAGKDERSDAEQELVKDWQRSQPEASTAVKEGNRVQGDDERGEAVEKYDFAAQRTAFATTSRTEEWPNKSQGRDRQHAGR
ncbi:hypothetical protein [Rhodococcus sp. DN22]|uniref:hypothetical protein n=1 Tax=Rhodococcus sp. DN22 TaxID=357684 RepID=UPI0030D0FC14